MQHIVAIFCTWDVRLSISLITDNLQVVMHTTVVLTEFIDKVSLIVLVGATNGRSDESGSLRIKVILLVDLIPSMKPVLPIIISNHVFGL